MECRACLLPPPALKGLSVVPELPLAVNFRICALQATTVTLVQHRLHSLRRPVNPVLDAQLGLDILFESATGVAKVIFARLEALLASQREVSVR